MCCDSFYADLDDSANVKKKKETKTLKFSVETRGNMAEIVGILGTGKTKELSVRLKVFKFLL